MDRTKLNSQFCEKFRNSYKNIIEVMRAEKKEAVLFTKKISIPEQEYLYCFLSACGYERITIKSNEF